MEESPILAMRNFGYRKLAKLAQLKFRTFRFELVLCSAFTFDANAEQLDPLFEFSQNDDISRAYFSPDSTKLITKSTLNDEPVTLRDAKSGEILCAWARSIRTSSNIAPNGRWMFVDTQGRNTAHFRDITNCNWIRYLDNLPIYDHFDTVFSADGRRFAGTSHPRRPIFNRNRWAYIYDIEEQKILNYVSHRSRNLFGMRDDKFHYFKDGETVLLWTQVKKRARDRSGKKVILNRRVMLQNVISEDILREWYFRQYWYQVAVHPDEQVLLLYDRENMTLTEDSLASGDKVATWSIDHNPQAMEYHPSGRWLVTITYKGLMTIIDLNSHEVLKQHQVINRVKRDGLVFAPDGNSFALGTSTGTVAVYPFSIDETGTREHN